MSQLNQIFMLNCLYQCCLICGWVTWPFRVAILNKVAWLLHPLHQESTNTHVSNMLTDLTLQQQSMC